MKLHLTGRQIIVNQWRTVDMKGDLRVQISRQKGRSHEVIMAADGRDVSCDNMLLSAYERVEDGVKICGLSLRICYEEPLLEEHVNLAMEAPVTVYIRPDEVPEKITSLYMFGPWWSRPGFADSLRDIPDRTQVALFRYADRCGCMVPMVGDRFKSYLTGGTEDEICLVMTALRGGLESLDEIMYVYAEADTAYEAVHKAFAWLIKEKGILPREERRVPEMFRYLGWCSWDAFYTDISADLVTQKADELIDKKVPVKWMLFDDGWFPSRDKMITGFAPDPDKFPGGFRPVTEDISSRSNIDTFGIWHALGGYWGGVDPESSLAAEEEQYLYRTANNVLIPDYRHGAGFYRDWCRLLKSEGIDFIKVDGQSTAPFYYENEVPVAEAARGMNRELESGSFEMDGAIINCMGMAMENVLARPASAISRNSDDFFPGRDESFVEHLLQNAYNSIYHNEIYCCDWDMFWTKHPYAAKHSLLRAISGGPVYFSDRIGETDPEVLKPLACSDGKLFMMARSARPTEDCIFTDPVKEGVLKLSNYASCGGSAYAGGIAAYNLSGNKQTVSFTADEVPEIAGASKYWVYDYFSAKPHLISAGEQFCAEIEKDGYAWYVIAPAESRAAFLGLLDKYAGVAAAEDIIVNGDSVTYVMTASGRTGWLSETEPAAVYLNGEDITDKVISEGCLHYADMPESGEKTILTIR